MSRQQKEKQKEKDSQESTWQSGGYFISSGCTSCEACVATCPTESIFMAGGGASGQFVIDTDSCRCHAVCVAVCPVDVIHPIEES